MKRINILTLTLVAVAATLASVATAQESTALADVPESEATQESTSPRAFPARPILTPGEYIDRASHFRTLYRKPPAEWPAPTLDEGVPLRELGKLPQVEHPKENPYSVAKAKLGKMLFFDPRLSRSQQIACASCHEPELGWADGRAVAFGHHRKRLRRNTPSLLNVALNKIQFWDGRAVTLEEQARAVILNPEEMNGSEKEIVARLSSLETYLEKFQEAFGAPEITLDRVTQAIAAFERTITSRRNPLDRFLSGESTALSDAAIRGLHLFRTEARCMNCHNGPTFSDDKFHDLGLSFYGRKLEDLGRYEVTRVPTDVGAFKAPSLRNIARTAPYMHNGLFDLDGLLRLYNAGMPTLRRTAAQKDDPLFPEKDRLLQPLGLNAQDLSDLRAFLESLTEAPLRVSPPPELPPIAESES